MLERMELLCFPSRDPLHDLVLPLYLRPTQVWLPVNPLRVVEGERLLACLKAHGFAVEWLDWPKFADCSDHAAPVVELLERMVKDLSAPEVVMALGESAEPWELVCRQVMEDLLHKGEYRVMVLTGDLRHAVGIAPGRIVMETLPSLLEPADYLQACNATLRRSVSDEAEHVEQMRVRRTLTFHLADRCADIGSALGTLNYLARQAVDQDGEALIAPKQQLPRSPARPLREALERMGAAELIDFDGGRELIFRSAEACRYVAGGWLEEYAWLTADELGAEHVHAGLELTWNAGRGISPRNELDLFVLHRNRALTVECKTSDMGEGDITARVLYKLDSIAERLSALPGNAVLLSARKVPDLIVKRARGQGIELFAAEHLTALRDWLGEWLDD